MLSWTAGLGIALTIGAYWTSRWLARRCASPLVTPVFFSTVLIIGVLLIADIPYESYIPARSVLTWLLGPATVALAVPVYNHRQVLLRYAFPALAGLAVGALVTTATSLALAASLGLSGGVVRAMAVKSITAPIAVELADLLSADASLAASFVVATGMIGAALGPRLLDHLGVRNPVARGLSLGTISHGQGTAQAVTEGELAGAVAAIATVLSAVFLSAAAPVLLRIVAMA